MTRNHLLSILAFLFTLPLVGCVGAPITSVEIPADSPYEVIVTALVMPLDDVRAETRGNHIDALIEIIDAQDGLFQYILEVAVDRENFSSGGVRLVSESAGIVGAMSLGVDAPGSPLSLTAGFSEGIVPGLFNDPNDFAAIGFYPPWENFDEGEICLDGNCSDVVGICLPAETEFEDLDVVLVTVNAPPGTYAGACGDFPVNLTINPPFETVGECISTLKQQNCSGLKGRDRASCNHTQAGVCHATFNVPSAHNN